MNDTAPTFRAGYRDYVRGIPPAASLQLTFESVPATPGMSEKEKADNDYGEHNLSGR
jgi:hypothetical protein